jgi:hypothetical protein
LRESWRRAIITNPTVNEVCAHIFSRHEITVPGERCCFCFELSTAESVFIFLLSRGELRQDPALTRNSKSTDPSIPPEVRQPGSLATKKKKK